MQAFKYIEIRIYSYDVDFMSKMADIPIFGNNSLKYSTLEPVERFEEA